MRAIVTGGEGFVGRHLCRALTDAGHEVVSIDITMPTAGQSHLTCDLGREAPPDIGLADVLFHLAASPWQGTPDDERIRNHAAGTLGALALAARCNSRFILASSAQVYGSPTVSPQNERLPVKPFEGYGWSKWIAERVTEQFCEQNQLSFAIARFSNVYGPGQKQGALIPDLIHKFKVAKHACVPVVELRGNGQETRDYLYVADVVSGLLALNGAELDGLICNIGSGRFSHVRDVADMVRREVGYEGGLMWDRQKGIREGAPDEAPRCLDIGRMKRATRWAPTVSLAEGLRRTVAADGAET